MTNPLENTAVTHFGSVRLHPVAAGYVVVHPDTGLPLVRPNGKGGVDVVTVEEGRHVILGMDCWLTHSDYEALKKTFDENPEYGRRRT